MRIAIIRRSFRFDGGAEKALSNFLTVYSDMGAEITLICESWSGKLPASVKVKNLPLRGSRANRQNSFRQQAQVYIGAQSFDHVQSHEWIPSVDIVRLGDGLHSKWLELLGDKKGRLWRYYSQLSPFHRQRVLDEKKTLCHPNLQTILVNSEFVGDQIKYQYPVVADKIVLVRNVVPEMFWGQQQIVDLSFESHRSAEKRLLFVGSGWERKGLVEALRVLQRLGSGYSLAVVGQDKRIKFYKQLAQTLGISDRVYFLGPKPVPCLAYQHFDGLILPSIYDPFPNVICEALVAGLPVYCSPMCGAVDFSNSAGVHICNSSAEYEAAIRESSTLPDSNFFQNQFSESNLRKAMEAIF
jgi:UDP-glucose:(heptosyl)LPS alpha-1,3-glucosyltransferase